MPYFLLYGPRGNHLYTSEVAPVVLQNTGMHTVAVADREKATGRYWLVWEVLNRPCEVTPQPTPEGPAIASEGVVNAADYSARLAPGAIVSVFGERFASATAAASGLPLPAALAGVSAAVTPAEPGRPGYPAPLYFVSPSPINTLLPLESALLEGAWKLEVQTPAGPGRRRGRVAGRGRMRVG